METTVEERVGENEHGFYVETITRKQGRTHRVCVGDRRAVEVWLQWMRDCYGSTLSWNSWFLPITDLGDCQARLECEHSTCEVR